MQLCDWNMNVCYLIIDQPWFCNNDILEIIPAIQGEGNIISFDFNIWVCHIYIDKISHSGAEYILW